MKDFGGLGTKYGGGGPGPGPRRVFINNPMVTITIRIPSLGLIFNLAIIDYRLDHVAIADYSITD